MNPFEQILRDLEIAAATGAGLGIPQASAIAAMSDSLIKIAQSAIKAHTDIVGEPLDLDKLQPID